MSAHGPLFDSHCHLDDPRFTGRREDVCRAAVNAGVTELFVPGTEPGRNAGLFDLVAPGLAVHKGVGLHPWYVRDQSLLEETVAQLGAAAARVGACAIGECGLDRGHASRGGAPLELQESAFELQLELAAALGLPVVLHVVGAHGRALEVLRRHRPGLGAGGVVHAYTGGADLVSEYCALGLSLGFGGMLTWPRAGKIVEAGRAVPLDRVVLETDAPDLSPAGVPRGRNEPALLGRVVHAFAELRGLTVPAVAALTRQNARRVYRVGAA